MGQRPALYVRVQRRIAYAGRTLAEVRTALRAAGVDVNEAAAYEAMARAFNDCEAEDMPLMAVRG